MFQVRINGNLTFNKQGVKDRNLLLTHNFHEVYQKVIILEDSQKIDGYDGNESQLSSGQRFSEISDLVIDREAYDVYMQGVKISFPKKEFELLLLLASSPRKVFKREEILTKIWGKDFRPKDSRSLDVHIRMIRKKLNDRFITTVRGVGYKLEK